MICAGVLKERCERAMNLRVTQTLIDVCSLLLKDEKKKKKKRCSFVRSLGQHGQKFLNVTKNGSWSGMQKGS